jgi:hypothetical protein
MAIPQVSGQGAGAQQLQRRISVTLYAVPARKLNHALFRSFVED